MGRDPAPGVDRREFLLGAGAALGVVPLLKACGGEGEAAVRVASLDRGGSSSTASGVWRPLEGSCKG